MSLAETRRHQMFPVLDVAQIETAKRFASGPARDFAPGETVFAVGERNVPSWLVHRGVPTRSAATAVALKRTLRLIAADSFPAS